ncbi:hypothetical protein KXD40_001395 [Peronospora effusa]|uniref:K Homology domain-containing protein n=1 Tax=Peronospora effusa TaxID=542832 RepID=A0A425BW68_9STRA|nr:hypothetical protein DD237_000492 [Peronospora effusa]UIZ21058.1 hypothetical protein KXD40_001395 [Peronospora effusa]
MPSISRSVSLYNAIYRTLRLITLNTAKNVSIPDHVSVGAVIGRGGSNCKALREKHGVRCFVDRTDRKVALKGPRSCIESAEDELVRLFASLETTKSSERRVFEVVARDGPSYWWTFQKDKEASSNFEVEEFPYRLQQSGRAVETASQDEAWIKEFHEDDTANVMSYLLETPSKLPPKIKLSFGKLCFKLKSIRYEDSTIAWPELQKLRNYHDFLTRWSNFCKRTSPPIAALMDDLEEWMKKGVKVQKLLSVHVAISRDRGFNMKYHLVEGQWELYKAYNKRHVYGSYDVIFNNDISFRLRAVTREKISKNASADIERHLDISIPDDGDFYRTKVSLNRTVPLGMKIDSFEARSKAYVEANGLCFAICYMDQRQEEFRLDCRLSNTEKEKLDVKDNEAQVVLKKVLQMLQ